MLIMLALSPASRGWAMDSPADVAKGFLDAMSRRDFEAMEKLMAPEFKMTVSGGLVFRHPREFAANSRAKQRTAKKTTDRFEEIKTVDGGIVFAIGSMAGEWNNGTTYANIRYIDRFEIENGKIVDMNVWSDMADFRPKD